MKNSKLKKILAVILSAAMMTSVVSVGSISASAAQYGSENKNLSANMQEESEYYTPPTTIDGTSNCVEWITEPTEEPFTIMSPPTTIDGTSNCVDWITMPTEQHFSSMTEPPEQVTEDTNHCEIFESTYVFPDDIVQDDTNHCEITEPTVFPENTTKIYFDAETSGWSNYKNIYCHIWKTDGTGVWPSWQTRKELCTKEEDGRYSYDTTKTGNTINVTDGRLYCVIFSADTGAQTYNMIMSGSCLGDTAYVTGFSFENPEDSEKKATEAAWRNNPDCGSQRMITSTGTIIGTAFPEGESDETILADYLIKYYNDKAKLQKTQNLIDQLNVNPRAVANAVSKRLNAYVEEGGMTDAEAEEIFDVISELLSGCNDPTIPTMPDTIPPSTTDTDVAPQDAKIYFDVESSGWKNYKNIFCHIWRCDGTGTWPNWQTRKEQCIKEEDGRYSYTLSKTGNEFRYSDGNVYGVIFSADTGGMTYDVLMNGKCIGDTVYATGDFFENSAPQDSEKKVVYADWRENKDGGARKKIISTGQIFGKAHAEGENDATMLADFLITYHNDGRKLELVPDLLDKLVVSPEDVLDEVIAKQNKALEDGTKTEDEVAYENNIIGELLKNLEDNENLIYDINNDTYTDISDATALQMYLAGYEVEVRDSKLDVDGDGVVDVKDVTALQIYLAAPKGGQLA